MGNEVENIVKSTTKEIQKIVKDPKNRNALIASAIAYYVSDEKKERNAIIAGLLAYTFLGGNEEDEDDE